MSIAPGTMPVMPPKIIDEAPNGEAESPPKLQQTNEETLSQLPEEFRENAKQVGGGIFQISWVDLPTAVKDWILAHPYQAAFQVVNGVVFFAPGLLSGPVLLALGWTAQGPRAASAASALQALLGQVGARSAFAYIQSAMMGGYGASAVATATRVGSIAVGLTGFWATEKEETINGEKEQCLGDEDQNEMASEHMDKL